MRIPMGNAGNLVAGPQQAAQIPQGANQQIAEAGARIAQVGTSFVDQQLAEQRIEAKKADEDLQRARTVRTLAETKNGLFDVQETLSKAVLAGEIGRDEAESKWGEESSKIIGAQLEQVDPRHRDLVSAQLLDTTHTLRTQVRAAVTKRTQAEFAAELINSREQLQREATRDRAAATQLWTQTIQTLGPQAGMDPKAIAADVQTFRERAAETEAYGLVNGARDSMPALAAAEQRIAGEDFADLDPQRRAVLTNTITGFRTALDQKALQAAQRAEIAAARHERQAASAFNALTTLSDSGKTIAPAFAAQVAQQVRGTVYEKALPSVLDASKAGSQFATQPIAVQRATLDQVAAKGNAEGWTPDTQKHYDRLSTALQATIRDYGDDPLRAALDRGVLAEIAPLSVTNVPDLVKSIGDRVEQAKQVAVVTGANVSPFTKDEAHQVGQLLGALPVKQRSGAIAELSTAVGSRGAAALAKQIDQQDRGLAIAMGFALSKTSAGRYTSELVLSGAQAIKDKVVKVENGPVVGWRGAIANRVRGVYANSEMEGAVIDAAFYIQAGLAAEGADNIDRAVNLASGNIIEHQGRRIPLPYGWEGDRFEQSLKAFPQPKIAAQAPDGKVYVSGTALPIDQFLKQLPKATLKHFGPGQYAATAGGGVVQNAQGRPIIIDVLNAGVPNAR